MLLGVDSREVPIASRRFLGGLPTLLLVGLLNGCSGTSSVTTILAANLEYSAYGMTFTYPGNLVDQMNLPDTTTSNGGFLSTSSDGQWGLSVFWITDPSLATTSDPLQGLAEGFVEGTLEIRELLERWPGKEVTIDSHEFYSVTFQVSRTGETPILTAMAGACATPDRFVIIVADVLTTVAAAEEMTAAVAGSITC